MRKLLMALGAAAAVWFLPVHVALLAVLLYIWASAATSTTNTAKTRAVEQRVNAVVAGQTTNNQAIKTIQTTISSGSTGTARPRHADRRPESDTERACHHRLSVLTGQTSGASAGTAHTHDYGGHWHVLNFNLPIATHTHDFDGHTHPLS